MLTALDETLLHQAPVTFDQTPVSDHRFFDRMWLGGCSAGDLRFIMGMANYKNTNTQDGYFAVQKAGRQYNLRLSRPLLSDPGTMRLGPLALEVVEPLRSLRVTVAPGSDHALGADITFRGTTPVREELPHRRRVDGRLFQDYLRFDQIGRADGWISIAGERFEVKDWFSARDHSWGVRAGMGGYEPATALPDPNDHRGDIGAGQQGFLALYLFFETTESWGYLQKHEDGAGRVLHEEGDIAFKSGDGRTIPVRTVDHELTFFPGTRVCSGGRLLVSLVDGRSVTIELQPHTPPWAYKGTGYDSGYDDEKGLGLHRGELLEYDVYDVSDVEKVGLPDGRTIRPWHREQACVLSVDGAPGLGHLPILSTGHIERYGLTGGTTNRRGE